MQTNTAPPAPPTSLATTRSTEPEVLAGIESAEGRPIRYAFDSSPPNSVRPLWLVGAGMVFGLLAGVGWGARRRS